MALGVILGCSGLIFSQAPGWYPEARHEPAGGAAVYSSAWQRIDEAQTDNHYDLGGHAGRAKGPLVQADQELKLEPMWLIRTSDNPSSSCSRIRRKP